MKASNMVEKHDPTIVATLKNDNPNKGYPCFIFRQSELQKMKDKYGKNLKILSGSLEEY